MSAPGIILAAPTSGAGKTTLALGILRALHRRGTRVGSFKVGPDYIDPAFHAAATGRASHNLDLWAMRFETLAGLLEESGRGCDLLLGEGVMGLFDGASDGTGSTADVAALFGLPVVLVIDVSGMGASVAALVDGFRRHREDVEVIGVILNRVASPAHADLLSRACFEHLSTPVLGCMPRDGALALPSRHLGLVQAVEHPDLAALLDDAAAAAEAHLDLDRLLRLARPPSVALLGPDTRPLLPLGQRTAVARDQAFAFVYPATLDGWRRQGVELLPFSPLADEAPDPAADAVYLPGGYPELHAGTLAGNERFRAGLRAAADRGAFVYGECGGYMVLGRALVGRDGTTHPMAGLLPVLTSFATPKLHVGYRQTELASPCPLGRPTAAFRGHEFHFAQEVERDGGAPLFRVRCARGLELGEQGCRAGSAAGSFLHLIDRVAGRPSLPRSA
jgi:cobyrinic acid a,c-diamide synthase